MPPFAPVGASFRCMNLPLNRPSKQPCQAPASAPVEPLHLSNWGGNSITGTFPMSRDLFFLDYGDAVLLLKVVKGILLTLVQPAGEGNQ